jgi:hypothetical protein
MRAQSLTHDNRVSTPQQTTECFPVNHRVLSSDAISPPAPLIPLTVRSQLPGQYCKYLVLLVHALVLARFTFTFSTLAWVEPLKGLCCLALSVEDRRWDKKFHMHQRERERGQRKQYKARPCNTEHRLVKRREKLINDLSHAALLRSCQHS